MTGRIVTGVVAMLCVLLPAGLFAQEEATGSPQGEAADASTPAAAAGTAPAEADPTAGADDESLQKRLDELEASQAGYQKTIQELSDRVEELEAAKTAHEEATRSIIREALSSVGAQINDTVVFGGTMEVLVGREESFLGESELGIRLNTAELDFEVQAGDFVLGSLIFQYVDGFDALFPTSDGGEARVDRVNVDTAWIRLGDTTRFWPYGIFGRMIVPFGISTGDPVADVLNLEDPLTLEVFETRENAMLFGLGFPTPSLAPMAPRPAPPAVKPQLLNPIAGMLSRFLGYHPLPKPPPTQQFITPERAPAPLNVGIYFFNGDTFERASVRGQWQPEKHVGATMSFRTQGFHLRRPWFLEIAADWNASVFDSRFLSFEYRTFLDQIGFVPGAATSVKASFGPLGVVGEWNGALDYATFVDDSAKPIVIRPSAWQIALSYQAGWKPSVTRIGAQGTYVALGYSQSQDLAGVTRSFEDQTERVGFVPESRFSLSVGEWVLENVRVAFEFTHNVDYEIEEGGTGQSANGVFSMLTLEW